MAIGDALVAPTGVQNQMVGQPSRVPGYSQGLSQAPGQMALPPEPMPIGRPTAVVGGPAYFTPAGYQAPPQPTQAFMPTDRAPDPIGQQFMRQMESPMGQQFQQQYEATQAPIREAEAAARAEAQAAQDARFQEMMDRIAELEGQLATPTPSPVPEPEPYIPGQTPFPGIPDFIRDLDFSGLPDFLNFDYDDIMRQYNDRMEMGEPEPIDSFLPDPRDLPPIGLNPPPGGFEGPLPGPKRDAGAMPPENNFFVDGDGNLTVGDGIIRTMGMPPFEDKNVFELRQETESMVNPYNQLPTSIRMPPAPAPAPAPVMPRISMPELPDFSNIPTPEPVLRAGDIMPNSPVVDRRPSPRMPAPPAVAPINIPKIPNIPNIDFSNLPKFDLPTTGGRPMIPNFGNINLR